LQETPDLTNDPILVAFREGAIERKPP